MIIHSIASNKLEYALDHTHRAQAYVTLPNVYTRFTAESIVCCTQVAHQNSACSMQNEPKQPVGPRNINMNFQIPLHFAIPHTSNTTFVRIVLWRLKQGFSSSLKSTLETKRHKNIQQCTMTWHLHDMARLALIENTQYQ